MSIDATTQAMIDGYMPLHEKGLSNDEIAAHFGLCGNTVRNHLETIAKANGVTRESLLYRPKYAVTYGNVNRQKGVDCQELLQDLNSVAEALEDAMGRLIKIVEEDER